MAGRNIYRGLPGSGQAALGCVDIQVMPACKWRFSALPVLTYLNVRSVPVLETHHFGRCAPSSIPARPDLNINTPQSAASRLRTLRVLRAILPRPKVSRAGYRA
jgi:hypothetical protein